MALESWTITEGVIKPKETKLLDPIHPGEILAAEFMKPLAISINRLSRELHVPPNRIPAIVHGPPQYYRGHRAPSRNLFRRDA